MTASELTSIHNGEALAIMADKTHSAVGTAPDANRRAEQCVVALRHVLCCWILNEASEAQLLEISKRYDPS